MSMFNSVIELFAATKMEVMSMCNGSVCDNWWMDIDEVRWQGKAASRRACRTGMTSLHCLARGIVGWTNEVIGNVAPRRTTYC